MHTIWSRMPLLAWIFLAALWGTTWVVARVGLNELPPFTFAGLRFLLASCALLALCAGRRVCWPTDLRSWLVMVGTGVTAVGVTYALLFWGLQFVPSGIAAVFFSGVPLLTIPFAHLLLPDEPATPKSVLGGAVGLLGVSIAFSGQMAVGGPLAAWALAGFLIGAAALAHAQVVIKQHGGRLDPLLLAGVQTGVGGVLLLVIGWLLEGNPAGHHWNLVSLGALGYLGLLGTAVGFGTLYWLMGHMAVTRVNTMMLVHPVVALALGWLVLNETIDWRVGAGAMVIGLGLAMLLSPARSLRSPATAEAREV